MRRSQVLPSGHGAHQESWDFTGEQPAAWAHLEPDCGARPRHHTGRATEMLRLPDSASGEEGLSGRRPGALRELLRRVR